MEKLYNGIVIFGEMGSGKDALADKFCKLRKHGKIYKISVLCREMMKVSKINAKWRGFERYIGQVVADKLREIDINIMCDYILALIYESGQKRYDWNNIDLKDDDFNRTVTNQLSLIRNHELSIIVGGRTLTDLNYWREKNYLIVGIKVSNEKRKNRLISRDGEDIVNNSDESHNTETDVPYIINNLCHEIIINDGTLEDLEEEASKLLVKYRF